MTLTACVLIANASLDSTAASLVGAASAAMLLLVAHLRGHRRMELALAWASAIVVVALLVGSVLSLDSAAVLRTGARVACGVFWVLWLGTQVDWASLRSILRSLGVPAHVLGVLDNAVLHGVLTQREWTMRRDAARLRAGASTLPLTCWGPLLGEGALQAFLRLEGVEETALLRSRSTRAPQETTDSAGLDLRGVHIERGRQPVLQNLMLSVRANQLLVVAGPSGAGKSSLLRVISGLDAPVHGTMTRLGVTVSPATTLNRRLDGRVALLSQNPEHHFIASTVADDIAWGLRRRGTDDGEARRRTREMAGALRIEALLERPCAELSFGEQRRVALAGLLVLKPALLLLDEPSAGLDPVTANELRLLVSQFLRETGAMCFWATHDLHSLPPASNRILLLHNCQIVFDGATEEGLSRPWLLRAGLAVPHEDEAN